MIEPEGALDPSLLPAPSARQLRALKRAGRLVSQDSCALIPPRKSWLVLLTARGWDSKKIALFEQSNAASHAAFWRKVWRERLSKDKRALGRHPLAAVDGVTVSDARRERNRRKAGR